MWNIFLIWQRNQIIKTLYHNVCFILYKVLYKTLNNLSDVD